MTDETDTSEINEAEPRQPSLMETRDLLDGTSVVAAAETAAPTSLDQFTYSIRHRPEFVNKPFANGNIEGRMKLGTHEYIVSTTTLDDLVTQMTVKADSLLANGYKVQG